MILSPKKYGELIYSFNNTTVLFVRKKIYDLIFITLRLFLKLKLLRSENFPTRTSDSSPC